MGHLDRTQPVDFCNQYNPRAQPLDRSIPGASARRDASSLRWTGRLPSGRGWGPFRLIDRRLRVTLSLWRRCEPCGSVVAPPWGASRGFTDQGPAGSRRPAPLAACSVPLADARGSESVQRSFAPTRSARTPLVTRPWRFQGESPEPSTAGRNRTMHPFGLASQTVLCA